MSSGSALSPSRRVLGGLAVVVVAAHMLLLQASAQHWGPGEQRKERAQAFATRSIELPPPQTPPAEKVETAPPVAKPKRPAAPVRKAPSAINSIANTSPPEPTPDLSVANATPTGAEEPAPVPPTPSLPPVAAPTAAAASVTAQATAPAIPETTRPGVIKLPEPVRISYTMTGVSKGLTYHADAELAWNTTGTQYQASMEVSALFLGSRSMSSSGEVTAAGLAPTRFLDKSRSERAAHFLAGQGKITFSANSPDAVWMEGAQDRVSVFMQLTGMLAGDPAAFPPGSSITLYTVGPQDADTWSFLVAAEEALPLPQGETLTLKLLRKPRRQYDQAVEIWFAPSLGYLPVRSRITQSNGDFVDQQLNAIVRP